MGRFWNADTPVDRDLYELGLSAASLVAAAKASFSATGAVPTVLAPGAHVDLPMNIGNTAATVNQGKIVRHCLVAVIVSAGFINANATPCAFQLQMPQPTWGSLNVLLEGSANNTLGPFPTIAPSATAGTVFLNTFSLYTSASLLFGTAGQALPLGLASDVCQITNRGAAGNNLSVLATVGVLVLPILNDQPLLPGNNYFG